jgi:hypothetical protein
MKLTNQHVSEKMLDSMIKYADEDFKEKKDFASMQFLNAFLELKQRRAEDRQRDFMSNG